MAIAVKQTRLTCSKTPSVALTNGSAGQFEVVLSFLSSATGLPANLATIACFGVVTTGFPTGALT